MGYLISHPGKKTYTIYLSHTLSVLIYTLFCEIFHTYRHPVLTCYCHHCQMGFALVKPPGFLSVMSHLWSNMVPTLSVLEMIKSCSAMIEWRCCELHFSNSFLSHSDQRAVSEIAKGSLTAKPEDTDGIKTWVETAWSTKQRQNNEWKEKLEVPGKQQRTQVTLRTIILWLEVS